MKPYYIKEYNLNIVEWSEAFLNFDKSIHSEKQIKFNYPGFYVSHEGHTIPKVESVLKDLNCNIAHLYFNITTRAKTFGRHNDVMDVYFWQCQGVTKWIFDNDEIILNPGDLIYIPKGVFHNVVPLSPRLGVSMSNE